MHDPKCVAHEIYLRKKQRKDGTYRSPFITIWHVDPEKDGTDDSCGWFIRGRHVDQSVRELIRKEFKFNFDHNYWFTAEGLPRFSVIGVVVNMYKTAAWKVFDTNRKKYDRFFRKHLHDIIAFAENPTDSLEYNISREMYYRTIEHDRSQVESRDERIAGFADAVYTDIMRKIRPWYKHPRWHIWHWEIQFHPWQQLKRRYWDKCCVCGKRGFKGSAMSDWGGTKLWHSECDRDDPKPMVTDKPNQSN